ncbi:MAG: LLM class flavin-dependent oxidoreductase [Micrococcales bacterium]|nr:LLM class flavin-dependent oxidoreductase [Micrococcales bacterium]
MPDYGLELEFGLFPTPSAADPQHVLELAHLAEASGLEHVSVQDHPYQAAHLDTWTLLSVIAARTTTVRVSPNVANLPLREPVVLARSAATLDLLSGGRVELGLGAGAFWDAIEAAGGPRRTPREAVDALVEAIEVIRGVWGESGERSVRVHGEHYRVEGLRPGPLPAHRIPIWVGAYKPRMLRLTGQLADGWVPSMGYADPPALGELNARIDEAAAAADRAPQDIRRIYNIFGSFGRSSDFLRGTAADWVEQLAGLALDEGMSTFILGTDDPDVLRRFAAEVVPAVRAQVADERALRAGRTEAPATRPPRAGLTDAPVTRPPRTVTMQVVATPDDGVRLTGPLAWDETSRPESPKPADAAYPPEAQAQAQHLIDVHDHLRGELAQVREVIDQVRGGLLQIGQARSIINTMTMRQNNWTLGAYCESYCRVVTGHHTLEDRSIFPHLRRSDPHLVDVLDRLEDEHHVIADVLEQLDQALVGLVGVEPREVGARLESLSAAVDLLTDTLLSHLAYEERELIHPLARHGMF